VGQIDWSADRGVPMSMFLDAAGHQLQQMQQEGR